VRKRVNKRDDIMPADRDRRGHARGSVLELEQAEQARRDAADAARRSEGWQIQICRAARPAPMSGPREINQATMRTLGRAQPRDVPSARRSRRAVRRNEARRSEDCRLEAPHRREGGSAPGAQARQRAPSCCWAVSDINRFPRGAASAPQLGEFFPRASWPCSSETRPVVLKAAPFVSRSSRSG
jgi:hypothetical protein